MTTPHGRRHARRATGSASNRECEEGSPEAVVRARREALLPVSGRWCGEAVYEEPGVALVDAAGGGEAVVRAARRGEVAVTRT